MQFKIIDMEKWNRKEYFEHYYNAVPCTYSLTTNIDITILLNTIKNQNFKFYPTMLYCISSIVNTHDEFKTSIDDDGNVGVFDIINPSYTIFNKETETFSSVWTDYNDDFMSFYKNYLNDIEEYGIIKKPIAKPEITPNLFNISSIPWTIFTSFNLNIDKSTKYLLPIFTMGKFFEQDGKMLLPLSIQVHHAVCDGFHASRFINELQETVNSFPL